MKRRTPALWMALASLLASVLFLERREDSRPEVAVEATAAAPNPPATSRRAILKRARERLSDLDGRKTSAVAGESREAALESFRQKFPGVEVDFDPVTGAPKHILLPGRFLTRASGVPTDPNEPVKQFIDEHAALFGHDSAELERARITREDVTAHNGLRTVIWQQQVAGVPVFESVLKANLTKNGDLITLGSHFLGDAARAAGDAQTLVAAPPLDAPQALVKTAESLGVTLDVAGVGRKTSPQGAARAQRLSAPGFTDTAAQLSWVTMDAETLRLAWQVETYCLQANEMFRTLVDVQDGHVLVRQSLTKTISNASYRVFTGDSPTPMSPGHSTPQATQPTEATRALVVTPALNTAASPEGWIPDGQNLLQGNNVDAYHDTNGDEAPDLPRAQGTNRVFDFTFTSAYPPSYNTYASVTQLFYVTNWAHDRLYELGFTESSGNFQTNNFGKGGEGNDALLAAVQHPAAEDSPGFSTPSDGSPGRMRMGVLTSPTPDRDSAFDTEVVLHEYCHGLTDRLVGGGVTLTQLQSIGLAEGWSDFYAMSLLSAAGDNVDGVYASGAYAAKDMLGLTQNYYYGIRRYPYTTDLSKNPLTFKDIDPLQAGLYAGVPLSPAWSVSCDDPSEVHNQGEVWCVALWECRRNLIQQHGWTVGNPLMLRLVTDGLKLSPANPTFIQARDAILLADLVNNNGANSALLWAGFAKRGLGAGASAPPATTTTGVAESFELPDSLMVTPMASWTAKGSVGGPFTPGGRVYTLINTGSNPLNWSVASNQTWLVPEVASGTLAPGASTTVTATFSTAANALTAGLYGAALTFTNTTSAVTRTRRAQLRVGPVDYFTESFDTGSPDTASQSFLFTPTIGGDGYTMRRTSVSGFPADPTGGTALALDMTTIGAPASVLVTPAQPVRLFGVSYSNFYVNSNGTITFGAGDRSFSPSVSAHFSLPRVSAFFKELVSSANQVTWKAFSDRVAVSWQGVYDSGLSTNTFQAELFFDGRIRITHLATGSSSTPCLVGLSRGQGAPADFVESNFNAYPATTALLLSFAASAAEGAAAQTGTVTVPEAVGTALTVNLASSVTSAVTVPASVTIPAGQSSATFSLTVVNDTLLDGTQTSVITADATGLISASRSINITDNETAALTLTAPTSVVEGTASVACSVSVPTAVTASILVSLSSNDTTEITVPASVTIPAGQTSVSFSASAPQDLIIDGAVSATITASVTGWTSGTRSISVTDDEVSSVVLTLNAETVEGSAGTPEIGRVSLAGGAVAGAAVTVSLATNDVYEAAPPASVTIPAGQSSAIITGTMYEDTLLDGNQTVIISATAFSKPAVTASIIVRDNDAASFTFDTIPSPQRRSLWFPVRITARDVNGLVLPSVAGTITQSASIGATAIGYEYPTAAFVNGVWEQNVRVTATGNGVRLKVTGPNANAQSNAFDVTAPPTISVAPASFTLNTPRYSQKTRAITITNNNPGTLTWNAAANQSWITLSPTGGSLTQGQSATVSARFSADALAQGSATAQISITSNDPVTPTVNVPVTMNVTAPVASFAMSAIPSPQKVNAPFAITLTARDSGGATVTDFEGMSINLTAKDQVTAGTQSQAATPAQAGAFTAGVWSGNVSVPVLASSVKLTAATLAPWALTVDSNAFTTTSDGALSLTLDSSVSENAGTLSGTITLSAAPASPVTVSLTSSLPNAATPASATVTIPAGSTIAPFTLNIINDTLLDGTQTASITAVAPGYAAATSSLNVTDDETAVLGISMAETRLSEGVGGFTGAVTMSEPSQVPVTITLSSSDTAAVTVPATVIMPAGATWVRFSGNLLQDTVFEPLQEVTLTASVAGWTAGTRVMSILDDEPRFLTLNGIPAAISEGAATLTTPTVSLSGITNSPVTVTLTSSDETELSSTTVTIPAGASSAPFSLDPVDDVLFDGDQTVTLTAVAETFATIRANVTVFDDDVHSLVISTIPAMQKEGVGFAVTVTAFDSGGYVFTRPFNVSALAANGDSGALPVLPSAPITFVNGVWTGTVRVQQADTNVRLSISAASATAQSNTFTVGAGPRLGVIPGSLSLTVPQGASGTAVLTIGNTGVEPLGWSYSPSGSISIGLTPSNGTIAPGGTQSVAVTLSTEILAAGAYSQSIVLNSNDARDPAKAVPVELIVDSGLHHFEWDPLPANLLLNAPVQATIRAKNAANMTLSSFNDQVTLGAIVNGTETTSSYGTQGTTSTLPFPGGQRARTTLLYSASEVGTAGRLARMALDCSEVWLPQIQRCVIRMKHTSSSSFSGGQFENSNWTTVYDGPLSLNLGWNEIVFTSHFEYNGTGNLLVDVVSFKTPSSYNNLFRYTYNSSRALYRGIDGENPFLWTSGYSYSGLPNVRFTRAGPLIRATPLQTSAFSAGVWTGEVSFNVVGSQRGYALANNGAYGASTSVHVDSIGTLDVEVERQLIEGQGKLTAAGVVSLPQASSAPVIVPLESSDTSEITLPSTVTIPAGQLSAFFDVTVMEDQLLDGVREVFIRAMAPGLLSTPLRKTVADNERTSITVVLPSSVTEGAPSSSQGSVQLGMAVSEAITVSLSSSDPFLLALPATVVVPAGQSSASFTFNSPNNDRLDERTLVQVVASALDLPSGRADIEVLDNESRFLMFTLTSNNFVEGMKSDGLIGVRLPGLAKEPVTIVFATSSQFGFPAPAPVTIPAGVREVAIPIILPDNSFKNSNVQVNLTASAAGFNSAGLNLWIKDNDVSDYYVSNVPTQYRNGPFQVMIEARNFSGDIVTSYNGRPFVTITQNGSSLAGTSGQLPAFNGGLLNAGVTVFEVANSAVLNFSDPLIGVTRSTNSFVVTDGAWDRFGWSAIGPQRQGVAFNVTAQARDRWETTVPYSGSAALHAAKNLQVITTPGGSEESSVPLGGFSYQTRSQTIYLAAEVGNTARTLRAMTFDCASGTYTTYNSFTIRLKHTAKTGHATSEWEGSGWTTVFSGSLDYNSGLSRSISFTTPFSYDGSSNLMVDISHTRSVGWWAELHSRTNQDMPGRTLHLSTSGQADPLYWSGYSPAGSIMSELPRLKFHSYDLVAVTPAQTGAMNNGIWNGQMTINESALVSLVAVENASRRMGISDSFEVRTALLAMSLSAGNVAEISAPVTGTLTISPVPVASVAINLTSSNTSAVTVPATVTIPAGQASITFPVTILDDGVFDGTQTAVITASKTNYLAASASLSVSDNETATLSLSLPANMTESISNTHASASVQLSATTGGDVTVNLTSNQPSRLQAPAFVTIPSGQSSATFQLTLSPDTIVNLNASGQVTASVTGLPSSSGTVQINDDESHQLRLSVASTIHEGAIQGLGRIYLDHSFEDDLSVALSSSDLTGLTVPATVTIPKGATQAFFALTPVDDGIPDGTQNVTLSAGAAGFLSGTVNVPVNDDDMAALRFVPICSPQRPNSSFPVTIEALTTDGQPAFAFDGSTVTLSNQVIGTAGTLAPLVTGNFVGGSWTGNVNLSGAGLVTLRATAGGVTAVSNGFTLGNQPSGASRFIISGLPADGQITSGTAYPVSIRAVNAAGATDAGYTDTAELTARAPGMGEVLVGGSQHTLSYPFFSTHDGRTQILYPASMLGGRAMRLQGLSLNALSASPTTYSNLTIRMKHATTSSYAIGSTFENTGWTTVLVTEGNFNAGWNALSFTTPFDYDGTSTLMIDISYDNAAPCTEVQLRASAADSFQTLFATSNSIHGAPTFWGSSGAPSVSFVAMQPQIRLTLAGGLAVSPRSTGSFVAGQWTGSLSFAGAGKEVALEARDTVGRAGSASGLSVDLGGAVNLDVEPAFTGGTSNTLQWPAVSGATQYEMQVAENAGFDPLVWSTSAAGTSASATSLTDGKLYYYRMRPVNALPLAADGWSHTDWGDFSTASVQNTTVDAFAGRVALDQMPGVDSMFTENFDALTGSAWSPLFSVLGGNSGYSFASNVLSSGPNATPPLPINTGGDREGRITGTHGWCLTSDTPANHFSDGSVEATFAAETPANGMSAAVVIRSSSVSGIMLGYTGQLVFSSATEAAISIGISGNAVASFPLVSFNSSDVFRLRLTATGPRLVLNAWKISSSGGTLVETAVTTAAGESDLVYYDSRFTVGRAGLRTFSGSSAILVEDISVSMRKPVYIGTGKITSSPFSNSVRQKWGLLRYSATVPASTAVTVDVLDAAGGLLAAGVASGTDLSTLPLVASEPAICLRANLSTTDTSVTPWLEDWSVGYEVTPNHTLTGAWSPVVSSTQDATPPQITATALTTTLANATLSGTASDAVSGLASLSVNGVNATTPATWSRQFNSLVDGANSVTIVAQDNAVPPNSSTVTTTIYRIASPADDTNGNGIASLLEHALGMPAIAVNAGAWLPVATTETENEQKYLCLQFRRRIERAGLTYTVETSTDLVTWDDTGASVVEKSAVPTGDGITELVTVRITPAMSLGGAKFVRLRVTSTL